MKFELFWVAMAPFGLKTGASGPKSRSGPVFQKSGADFGQFLPLGPIGYWLLTCETASLAFFAYMPYLKVSSWTFPYTSVSLEGEGLGWAPELQKGSPPPV